MTTTNIHEYPSSNTNYQSDAEGFTTPNEVEPEAPKDLPEEEQDLTEVTYEERLRKLDIAVEQATKIIDEMCDNGSYIHKVVVRKAREDRKEVTAALITRDTRTQGFITEYVSRHHQDVPVIYNKLMGELQLAASLVYYNSETYPLLSDIEDNNEFEKELFYRVKKLSKLPAPITVKLSRELGKFDLMIAAVMAPGYEDFF